jgi:hypothetical protein
MVCWSDQMRISPAHVKMHGLTVAQYKEKYPNAPTMDEELRLATNAKIKAKHHDPAVKARMSESCKKVVKTAEWNRKNSEGQRGKIIPQEVRDKMSASAKVRVVREGPPHTRPGVLAGLHAAMETDEYKRAHAEGQAKSYTNGWDGLNNRIAKGFDDLARVYAREFMFPGVAPWRYDFAFIEAKTILEMQGCRWHSCPVHPDAHNDLRVEEKAKRARLDKAKRTYALREGWIFHTIWEHDVPKDALAFDVWMLDVVIPLLFP